MNLSVTGNLWNRHVQQETKHCVGKPLVITSLIYRRSLSYISAIGLQKKKLCVITNKINILRKIIYIYIWIYAHIIIHMLLEVHKKIKQEAKGFRLCTVQTFQTYLPTVRPKYCTEIYSVLIQANMPLMTPPAVFFSVCTHCIYFFTAN